MYIFFAGIERLRQLIYSVAENMTVAGAEKGPKIMGEMIPSSYMSLAKIIANRQVELQVQNKIPIIRKCQFEDLVIENAAKTPKDVFDPDDVDNATKFLHEIGEKDIISIFVVFLTICCIRNCWLEFLCQSRIFMLFLKVLSCTTMIRIKT